MSVQKPCCLDPPKARLRIVKKKSKHAVLLRYGVVFWDYQIKKFNLKGDLNANKQFRRCKFST
ncbi:hypothetical protein DMB92_08540 [Campylobacter sp. MIT 99-7217]|nr:hypothetical protein DMB92_08540 [Campylobacter sp. MIT 99-7217]